MFYTPSDDYGDLTFNDFLTDYSFGGFLLGTPQTFFAITSPQINPTHGAGEFVFA